MLGLAILLGHLLELESAFVGNTGVGVVGLADLLVEQTTLLVLFLAVSTRLFSLVLVKLVKLTVDGYLGADFVVMLHVLQFVVDKLLLDGA